MDLGCRKSPHPHKKNVKYYPVDYEKHDEEIIVCDFNKGEFPDLKVDTCLCAFTAEFVAALPDFLKKICNAAQKQVLMICRPIDKEIFPLYRWQHQMLTDFTEKFLIETMQKGSFELISAKPFQNPSVILYDFRKKI